MSKDVDEARRVYETDPNACNERLLSLAYARAGIKGKSIRLVTIFARKKETDVWHISRGGDRSHWLEIGKCGVLIMFFERRTASYSEANCNRCIN